MLQRNRADQTSLPMAAARHSRTSKTQTRHGDETPVARPLSSNAYTRIAPAPGGWPEGLPEGETLLWTGKPQAATTARRVLRIRVLAAYFATFAAIAFVAAVVRGQDFGAALLEGLGMVPAAVLALGLVAGFAVLVARTTRYAITDRRVVMRFGIAIPVTLNLPFSAIAAADVKTNRDGSGEIALALTDPRRVLYATLWPHARPWHVGRPQPALRGLADVVAPAKVLSEALRRADVQRVRPALRVVAASPAAACA